MGVSKLTDTHHMAKVNTFQDLEMWVFFRESNLSWLMYGECEIRRSIGAEIVISCGVDLNVL